MARSMSGVCLVAGLAMITLLLLAHQASAHGSHAASPKSKLQVHQALLPPPFFCNCLSLFQFIVINYNKILIFLFYPLFRSRPTRWRPSASEPRPQRSRGLASGSWYGPPPQCLARPASIRRGACHAHFNSDTTAFRCRGAGWTRRARETGSASTRPPTPA
jgi:hypothetical protein